MILGLVVSWQGLSLGGLGFVMRLVVCAWFRCCWCYSGLLVSDFWWVWVFWWGLGFWFSWCLMGLLAGLVLWRGDLWFGCLGNLLRFRSGVVRYNTVPACLTCGDCL